MDSFADVIECFGGPPGFAAAIAIPESHARTLKARDTIPRRYFRRTVRAAIERGLTDITYDVLAAIAEAHEPARTRAS